MRGETMKGKSKKSTYSTTFGVDPKYLRGKILPAGVEPASMVPETIALSIKLRELF